MNKEIIYFKELFILYVNSYFNRKSEEKIDLKYSHSLRVANLCFQFANEHNWTESECFLSYIIGLFHDIGRFPQWYHYRTFWDSYSLDHGKMGVKILKNQKILNKLTNKERRIVYNSIYYHNKKTLPKYLSTKTKKIAKLIRDVDKIDNIYLNLAYYKQPTDNELNKKLINKFLNNKVINYKHVTTNMDMWFLTISWWNDLNYNFSKQYLHENEYINRMIKKIPEKFNLQIKEKIDDDYEKNQK